MFKQDLEYSHIADAHIIQVFKNAGKEAWDNPHKDYNGLCEYDTAFYDGTEWHTENKTDWYSLHSGNFCIETPTLEHTKSHYWIHIEPCAWIIPTHKLRLIHDSYPKKLVGDQKLSVAMIPKTAFKQVAKPLWKFLKDNEHN